MKFVIQRVKNAKVTVDGEIISAIGQGFLVLVGVTHSDTEEIAAKMVKKLIGLRIFADGEGKTNLDLKAVSGSLLLISQFTLYADCRKGNRPSFTNAGAPGQAESLYQYMIGLCRQEIPDVQEGQFGADMQVSLENDGPFTVILDSAEICPAHGTH